MPQAIVSIGEFEDRILTIVKGKFGLKNKSEAMNLIIKQYQEKILEPTLKPEYLQELKKISKEKGTKFKNIKELRAIIEK